MCKTNPFKPRSYEQRMADQKKINKKIFEEFDGCEFYILKDKPVPGPTLCIHYPTSRYPVFFILIFTQNLGKSGTQGYEIFRVIKYMTKEISKIDNENNLQKKNIDSNDIYSTELISSANIKEFLSENSLDKLNTIWEEILIGDAKWTQIYMHDYSEIVSTIKQILDETKDNNFPLPSKS